MHIRKAGPDDQTFIIESQLAMAKETEDLELDPTVLAAGVKAVFDDERKGFYWIAVDEVDKPVACLLLIPEWSDWRNGTVFWIHSVYVQPLKRRSGAFRALYAALKQEVFAQGELKGLRLYVDRRNTRAQKVYESLGMSSEHYLLYEWLK